MKENRQKVKGQTMNMSQANPKVDEIRRSARKSFQDMLRLVDGPLAQLAPEKLYASPIEGEWSIMENLAHIAEFMPYWGDQITALVAQPGKNFGRTQQDEGRLRAIREHATDTLEEARASMDASYVQLDEKLARLRDSDLEIKGVHSRYGEKSLDWFIEDFVTGHLEEHVVQMQEAIEAVK
jgi:uncharacterized damage-inducible protein DinB